MRIKSIFAMTMAIVLCTSEPFGISTFAGNAFQDYRNVKMERAMADNVVSDNSVSGNLVSGNSISGNSISENSISENSVWENSVSDNSVSGNGVLPIWRNDRRYKYTRELEKNESDSNLEDVNKETQESNQLVLSGCEINGLQMETYKSIRITWSAVRDATGYDIYRSLQKNSGYELVKSVNATTLTLIDKSKKLVVGKKYYYKVVPFAIDGSKKILGDETIPKRIQFSLPKVKFKSAKPMAGGTLQLKWTKVKGADGYEIRRAEAENGKYKKFKVVESKTAQKLTLTSTECNGSYYYKIRAYRLVKKKKIYGEYSIVKKAEMQNFAYDGESFEQKCLRVFGTKYYKRFSSQNQAKNNMTTITVKVWDIGVAGNKITKSKTIVVNANLATTVEQIFAEIYAGKEKFPMKSVGGFSWRGDSSFSEHNQGTAIDINPTENCMVEGNGTVSAGSYWRPGSDPYSIPAKGEVVKIFKKYGFRWGGIGWSSGRKDYMHFSYFGT